MKIAIMTRFPAKWNMYVKPSRLHHGYCDLKQRYSLLWYGLGLLLFFFASYSDIRAQSHPFVISLNDTMTGKRWGKGFRSQYADTISIQRDAARWALSWHKKGYLAAGVDSLKFDEDTFRMVVYIGPHVTWASLNTEGVPEEVLIHARYKARWYDNRPLRAHTFYRFEQGIIVDAEDRGLPFARVWLDSISWQDNRMSAQLRYNPGPVMMWDTIVIAGESVLKEKFIRHYIRVYKGDLYKQKKADEIEPLLKRLPYLTIQAPSEVRFSKEGKASLYLYLAKRRANRLDGFIGFQPNAGATGKLVLTGEATLHLQNLFSSGKAFYGNWRRFEEASQTLEVYYDHPRFLGTSLDMRLDLDLLKQDSSFFSINRTLQLRQALPGLAEVLVETGVRNSNTLESRPVNADSTSLLFGDYRQLNWAIGYRQRKLDDNFFPKKGWLFNLTGRLGNRTIFQNPELNPSIYSGLALKNNQWAIELEAMQYLSLGRSSVLQLRQGGAKLFQRPENIFINDMYRIGGLSTLRGFNEWQFYASTYALAGLEYRFYTGTEAYLLVFTDAAWMEQIKDPVMQQNWALGTGAGFAFQSPAGLFTLVYALGADRIQRFDVNLSKIHFGFLGAF